MRDQIKTMEMGLWMIDGVMVSVSLQSFIPVCDDNKQNPLGPCGRVSVRKNICFSCCKADP